MQRGLCRHDQVQDLEVGRVAWIKQVGLIYSQTFLKVEENKSEESDGDVTLKMKEGTVSQGM